MPCPSFPRALRCAFVITLAAATVGALAQRPSAHQHGLAKLAVAVDGALLEITLDSPLDNLLAFERAPRTDAERAAVRQLAQRFHAAASLFTPTPAARCAPAGVEMTSDVLPAALLAPAGPATGAQAATPAGTASPAAPGGGTSGGHADLQATLRFRCAVPAALKDLDASPLFKTFPTLRQVDAAVATGSSQRGSVLSARQPRLAW